LASEPQISVTIPTKNSARTLKACLSSVVRDGLDVELIVADDRSSDGTPELARSFGARVLPGPLSLLEARFEAFRAASSEVILMLDSDQVVEKGALPRCLDMIRDFDALVLEERSLRPQTWVAELFAADKRVLNATPSHHMNPTKGSLLPRAFRKPTLEAAFDLIPARIRGVAQSQDHALIYSAVARVTDSIGFLPMAVRHHEMESLQEVWRKYFAWGFALAALFEQWPEARSLAGSKTAGRFRKGDASLGDYVKSLALLGLKALPWTLGYGSARLRASLQGTGRSARS
jgi:glycosyltransferase involved in cell wall biosynthesis